MNPTEWHLYNWNILEHRSSNPDNESNERYVQLKTLWVYKDVGMAPGNGEAESSYWVAWWGAAIPESEKLQTATLPQTRQWHLVTFVIRDKSTNPWRKNCNSVTVCWELRRVSTSRIFKGENQGFAKLRSWSLRHTLYSPTNPTTSNHIEIWTKVWPNRHSNFH